MPASDKSVNQNAEQPDFEEVEYQIEKLEEFAWWGKKLQRDEIEEDNQYKFLEFPVSWEKKYNHLIKKSGIRLEERTVSDTSTRRKT